MYIYISKKKGSDMNEISDKSFQNELQKLEDFGSSYTRSCYFQW